MERLNQISDALENRPILPFVLSTALHLILFGVVILLPYIHSKPRVIGPVIDVTLFDLPGMDISPSSTWMPPGGSQSAANSDKTETKAPPKSEPVKETKKTEPEVKKIEDKKEEKKKEPEPPPKSKNLTEPSDAELKRLKKKGEKTPPPKKSSPGTTQPQASTPASTSNSEVSGSGNGESKGHEFSMGHGFFPGGKGSASGSMQLDIENFPFMYYLNMMKNKISENWIPPFGSVKAGEAKRVVIYFRVERSGNVLQPIIEESSGSDILDQSAIRAVMVSGPFPPLPVGYNEATLGIHFGFSCQL